MVVCWVQLIGVYSRITCHNRTALYCRHPSRKEYLLAVNGQRALNGTRTFEKKLWEYIYIFILSTEPNITGTVAGKWYCRINGSNIKVHFNGSASRALSKRVECIILDWMSIHFCLCSLPLHSSAHLNRGRLWRCCLVEHKLSSQQPISVQLRLLFYFPLSKSRSPYE